MLVADPIAPRVLVLGLVGLLAAGCQTDAVIARERADGGDAASAVADGGADAGTARDVGSEDGAAEADGSGGDAGSSGPLGVHGEAEAYADLSNESDPGQYHTQFVVSVRRGDVPVTGATVTLTSQGGSLSLAPSGTDGSYAGEQSGYFGSYTLTIVAGTDTLSGAAIAGPAVHVFQSPLTDEVHFAGQDLAARWSPSGASAAEIEAGEMGATPIADTGAFTVAGAELRADPGQVQEGHVLVRRSDTVAVPGAAAGSVFRLDVRNDVRFAISGGP